MDEELTASERRAAKRRARAEAGKNAPTWAKVTAWSIVGIAAVAVLFAVLSAGPPKYGVISSQTVDGVTGYTVGVTSWDADHPEEITRDLWTKNGGSIVVRIMCTSNPLNERYLGGGTQSTAGNTAVTTAPNARCP